MGQVVGDKVIVSLDLMYHNISIGHVDPVLHSEALVSVNHTVNLFLDFSCKVGIRIYVKWKRLDFIFLIMVTLW